jgi:hypothetical protein
VAEKRRWAQKCYSEGSSSGEQHIRQLVEEARGDYGFDFANAWTAGYQFPEAYVVCDVKFLQSQMLNFTFMVRRRLRQLSPDRLSNARVEQLRQDNPERALLFELVGGMKVHRPVAFSPNWSLLRIPLRSSYESVAPAVNKVLGAVIKQKLAILLPLCVPELHLCKAHWTTKKG